MLFSNDSIPSSTRQTVNNMAETRRIPQSVIVYGATASLRKKCIAELLAAVNCVSPENGQPCMKCSHCRKTLSWVHPDVTEVKPEEGKKSVSVKVLRETVTEKVYLAPNEAENKAFVFYDASELSEQNQNTLLKIIEEPPDFVMFVFEADTLDGFLATVLSRCTKLFLGASGKKAGKDDEKVYETAKEVVSALCRDNEFGVMMALSPLVRNRNAMKKCAGFIKLFIRDALSLDAGGTLIGDEEDLSLKLSSFYDTATLLKISSKLDDICAYADANANENLLITAFSSCLGQALKKRR